LLFLLHYKGFGCFLISFWASGLLVLTSSTRSSSLYYINLFDWSRVLLKGSNRLFFLWGAVLLGEVSGFAVVKIIPLFLTFLLPFLSLISLLFLFELIEFY